MVDNILEGIFGVMLLIGGICLVCLHHDAIGIPMITAVIGWFSKAIVGGVTNGKS